MQRKLSLQALVITNCLVLTNFHISLSFAIIPFSLNLKSLSKSVLDDDFVVYYLRFRLMNQST